MDGGREHEDRWTDGWIDGDVSLSLHLSPRPNLSSPLVCNNRMTPSNLTRSEEIPGRMRKALNFMSLSNTDVPSVDSNPFTTDSKKD